MFAGKVFGKGSESLNIEVGAEPKTVYFDTADGQGSWIPNEQAPAIALAVLEAAGYVPNAFGADIPQAAYLLRKAVEASENRAKENALMERREAVLEELGYKSAYADYNAKGSVRKSVDKIIELQDKLEGAAK